MDKQNDDRTTTGAQPAGETADEPADGDAESHEPNDGLVGSMDRRDYMKAVGTAAATGLSAGAMATPAAAITSNQTGTDDGYFY